jgi:hypothetical protein
MMHFCYSISIVSENFAPSETSPPTTTSSSHSELLEQLKTQLAAPLFRVVSEQLTSFQKTVVSYENKLQYAELKIQVLEERLHLQRIAKYGPGSEKLTNEQLELLELEPGVSQAEVAAESERPAIEAAVAKPSGKKIAAALVPCFCGLTASVSPEITYR